MLKGSLPQGQLPLGIRLQDSSVFESFFPGRNRPVVDALLGLASGEQARTPNTLL